MCGTTSALRKAIRAGDTERVKQILEEAGPSASDLINEDQSFDCLLDWCARSTQHPLLTALYYPHEKQDIITLLVVHGADVTVTGSRSRTPLHIAARADNHALACLFIENGADFHAQDDDGQIALHFAVGGQKYKMSSRRGNVMRYFLDDLGFKEQIMVEDDGGNTPLHVAVKSENIDAVKYLLSQGANPLRENANNQSPFSLASDNHKLQSLLNT